jgi:hypothetical protein
LAIHRIADKYLPAGTMNFCAGIFLLRRPFFILPYIYNSNFNGILMVEIDKLSASN